ncbi:hypothetical protein [Aquamicrobium sp. LC103]|uniref:hypothetical protein n=1 Tax=Aquamicrobium sp. LC103 TaxID=1120658 RepID=UPI000A5CBE22|nr:hypothetical protein [Aquamicrobium sp. LC103]
MGMKEAQSKKGQESAERVHREAMKEERRTEARKGSDLKKGGERFEERAMSSDRRGKD